jgi:hypothetical protein
VVYAPLIPAIAAQIKKNNAISKELLVLIINRVKTVALNKLSKS